MIALRSLLGFLGRNRSYLTLLLVAVSAAALWAAFASVRADRDATVNMAERICAAVGSAYQPDQGRPGEDCFRKVQQLVAFRNDTQAATAQSLIAAMQARERKQTEDAERRAAAREAQRAAANAMTTAEEQIHDDQVTGSWFAALNRLAGLRAPSR